MDTFLLVTVVTVFSVGFFLATAFFDAFRYNTWRRPNRLWILALGGLIDVAIIIAHVYGAV